MEDDADQHTVMDSPVSKARHALRRLLAPLSSEAGTTIIETSVATVVMLIVTTGLLSMGGLATKLTENEGHLAARTTEYAQDKMEQLLALAYSDSLSNTVVFPTVTSGGSGLSVGGSTNTSAPVNKYVDWLGVDGALLGGGTTAPSAWFYERAWQVSTPATGIKQITVAVTVRTSVGGAMAAKSTVVALKASQF